MEYPIYKGEKDSCLQCGRKFEEGEVMTVAGDEKTFCSSGCIVDYFLKNRKAIDGKHMRFRK